MKMQPAHVRQILFPVFTAAFVAVFVATAPGLLLDQEYADPQPRESWHACVANGNRFGSRHVIVTKDSDDCYRYQIDSRVLVDLLGARRQEIATEESYLVTADLRPVSVRFKQTSISGEMLVEGAVSDGKLNLTITRGELVTTRSIDVTDDTILSVCLDDFLFAQSRLSKNPLASFTLIDTDEWNASSFSAERQISKDSHIVWSVGLDKEFGQGTITLDENGVNQETIYRMPPMHMVRCTKLEAADLQYRKLVGRDVLMFPLSKDIGLPERLQRLRIQLTWKDVPPGELELTDRRQKIIEQKNEDGAHSVTLEITAVSPVQSPLELPIRESRFEPYLAETRFIKPNDEAIKRQARQWAGDTTNSLEAVRSLSQGVSKYLEGGTLIAETLSGPEVLQSKQGKCSEFSTLFASLARSIGIPTRIVLGERLSGGQWVGHMWNEAWVGEWVSVDTTVDEVGTSFSLIKLTQSDTVMGTQKVRFGLTESLNIEVVEFEKASTSISNWKTGIIGQTYTNADFACRLTAANNDWELVEKKQPGAAIVQFKVPDKGVLVHFVAFAVPANIGPDKIGKGRHALFASQLDDFEMLTNETFEIGDVKGQIAIFQGTQTAGKKKKTKTTEYIWIESGGAGFILNLIANPEKHDEYRQDLDKLLESFERLTKTTDD